MKPELEKNIDTCEDMIRSLKLLQKSKATGPDIFFLIDKLKTKMEWLKTLYKQKIP